MMVKLRQILIDLVVNTAVLVTFQVSRNYIELSRELKSRRKRQKRKLNYLSTKILSKWDFPLVSGNF